MAAENFYAACSVDRAAEKRKDDAWLKERLSSESTIFLPMWKLNNLVAVPAEAGKAPVPVFWSVHEYAPFLASEKAPVPVFLGLMRNEDRAVFTIDLSDVAKEPPCPILDSKPYSWDSPTLSTAQHTFADLRTLGPLMDADNAALLGAARGLMAWASVSSHCSKCGSTTALTEAGHARECLSCKTKYYPRTDPAVIMLITCGEYCLLGRQHRWPPGRYSALAGFVEPGESLEDAVTRESWEEASIKIERPTIQYHSSQPWPFPCSLMIGFYARLPAVVPPPPPVADGEELEDCRWFHHSYIREQILQENDSNREATATTTGEHSDIKNFRLPGPYAIARRLVDDWLLSV